MKNVFEIGKAEKIINNNFNTIDTFDELVECLNNNGINITDEELFEVAYKYPVIDQFVCLG